MTKRTSKKTKDEQTVNEVEVHAPAHESETAPDSFHAAIKARTFSADIGDKK